MMKSFVEKVESMMATILDIMEVEPGSSEVAVPVAEEELPRDNELSSDAHHKLIELCW